MFRPTRTIMRRRCVEGQLLTSKNFLPWERDLFFKFSSITTLLLY